MTTMVRNEEIRTRIWRFLDTGRRAVDSGGAGVGDWECCMLVVGDGSRVRAMVEFAESMEYKSRDLKAQ